MKLHTIKAGWSFLYIEGSQAIISKKILCIVFLSLNMDFFFSNSADPDEMLHYTPFHLGLRCLSKYPFRGFWSTKCYGNKEVSQV